MSRDLMDESYYVSHGGKIPVKWTAPEVKHFNINSKEKSSLSISVKVLHYKKCSSSVMCGALGFSCMRYGVWDTNHLKVIQITRYILYLRVG